MAAVSTEDLLTQEMDDIFQDDDEVMDNGVLDSKYDNIDEDDETAGPVTIKSETKQKSNNGFMVPMQLSTELSEFLGLQFAPRTEVTKLIWAYIRENDLQNPKDKREILCDDRLESLFKKKKINMFKMTKRLCSHMKSVEELQEGKTPKAATKAKKSTDQKQKTDPASAKSAVKRKASSDSKKQSKGADPPSAKKVKKIKKEKAEGEGKADSSAGSGSLCALSPSLAALVGRSEETRFQVTKLIWKHIKENNLQKDSDKRQIVCDEKMKLVFGVDQVHMFTMNKLLASHFLPK